MSSTTQKDLTELTVAALKEQLHDLGVDPKDVEPREAKGTEPIKADLIRAVQEAEVEEASDNLKTFRYSTFQNPKTGRTVTKHVSKVGRLVKRNRVATGLEYVEQWTEVRATSRPDALTRIEAGEGTRYRRNGDGEVEEVSP